MGGFLHLEQPGGLKDDTYLLISVGVRGAVLGMALRRDVARCVKVVDILAVDSDLENSRLLLMKFGSL